MRLLDSRRLTGPSLLLDRPGAILDIATGDASADSLAGAWRRRLREMLEALGWDAERDAWRPFTGGCSLAFTAPFDALYAATEINEWVFEAALSDLSGTAGPGVDAGVERLRDAVARERNPALVALAEAAEARGVTFLSDTKRVSVGLGTGSRSWPLGKLPAAPDRVRWSGLHDVPVALVTGTNGKTTTVRLLGAMTRAAGRVAGITSTDRVDVGDETVAVGDYSGPNGARTVLRDRRVELALLEVARGGILRRGLPVRRAEVALVTNVANDHLGEYGIFGLDALADAKMVVAKAVGREGRVVLNADDPRLLVRGAALDRPVAWFTLEPRHPHVVSHVATGGDACVLDGDVLVLHRGGERHAIARVGDVPIAFGGAARHNVANALAALGVASALDLPREAMTSGLCRFESSPAGNPGRTNQWELNGVRVIVDFAHNPHGLEALIAMAAALRGRRRALVIGQAGDRDDAAIAELARVAWALHPDRVFIKEMEKYLRGRERGAVPAMIERELRRAGARDEALSRHDSELEAVEAALEWARPGDLLLLTVHTDRDAVIEKLEDLAQSGRRT
jgi:cyanophycin synthetase